MDAKPVTAVCLIANISEEELPEYTAELLIQPQH
jgi:hypothetical protein